MQNPSVDINEAIKSQQAEIAQHIDTMRLEFDRGPLVVESFKLTLLCEVLADMIHARGEGKTHW
jgi:hypothetical protein